VYKAMDQSAKDFGPPMVVEKAMDAFTCWYNVKDVLHRLFLLTPAFATKWDTVVIDLQRLIIRRHESLPLLGSHGIVFELLNSLAHGFFNQVCRPEVSKAQVEAALEDLYVEPDSEWFRTIYVTAERRATTKRPKPVVEEVERPKKARVERHDEPKAKRGSGKSGSKPPCYDFCSTSGCATTGCQFSHKALSSDIQKARVRKTLLRLGLDPDPAKVGEE